LIRSGFLYRVIKDHLGSVGLVLNANTGTIAQRFEYGAFWNVHTETGSGFQAFGYAGGLYDSDPKLFRFRANEVYGLAIRGLASIGVGPALGFLDRLVRPASSAAARTIRLATLRPGIGGATDNFGNIRIARGLSTIERSETLRRELVHRFFSPQASSAFAEQRAKIGMWKYKNSSLIKYTEEATTEGIAKGSIRAGLAYLISADYVTVGGVNLEGGIYFGTIGAALYVGATQ
jgi:hypothetical protein